MNGGVSKLHAVDARRGKAASWWQTVHRLPVTSADLQRRLSGIRHQEIGFAHRAAQVRKIRYDA